MDARVEPGHDERKKRREVANAPQADWQAPSICVETGKIFSNYPCRRMIGAEPFLTDR